MGDNLYFVAFDGSDKELWYYDGTTSTKININPSGSSDPNRLTVVGNMLYLSALKGSERELWQVIDKTAIKIDINTTTNYNGSSDPDFLTAVDDSLYLVASDGTNEGVWRVIGATATRVGDHDDSPYYPTDLLAVGNALYMRAYSAFTGGTPELWKVAGTTPTRIDIEPGISLLYPSNLTAVEDRLYLGGAREGQQERELWQVVDATPTKIDINTAPGGSSAPENLVAKGNTLYLTASDGTARSFWRISGLTATKISEPLSDNAEIDQLVAVENSLYFGLYENGESELWRLTDGNLAKIDINPQANGSSYPNMLTAVGKWLYLSAFDGVDRELWEINGLTPTKIDLFTGSGSGEVSDLYATSDRLYFSAWGNITSGAELWTLKAAPPEPVNDAVATLSGAQVNGNVLANDQDPQQSSLTVSSFNQPSHGNATIAQNGIFTYTPALDFVGINSFSYSVMNAYQVTSTATVVIVVGEETVATNPPTTIVTTPGVTATQTITSQDFSLSLQVPAGAYSGTLDADDLFFLVYTPVVTPTGELEAAPGNFTFAGISFHLEAYLNGTSLAATTFATPILLEIEYPLSAVEPTNAEGLSLLFWNPNSNAWESDGIEVVSHNIEARRITFAIHHLSDFALFAPSAPQIFLPTLKRQ